MYKYNVKIYTGIMKSKLSSLFHETVVESEVALTDDEVGEIAYERMNNPKPRGRHYEVLLVDETNMATENNELKHRMDYINKLLVKTFWDKRGNDFYILDKYVDEKDVIKEITIISRLNYTEGYEDS